MKNTLNILLFLLAGTLVSDNCDAFRHRSGFKNGVRVAEEKQQSAPVAQQAVPAPVAQPTAPEHVVQQQNGQQLALATPQTQQQQVATSVTPPQTAKADVDSNSDAMVLTGGEVEPLSSNLQSKLTFEDSILNDVVKHIELIADDIYKEFKLDKMTCEAIDNLIVESFSGYFGSNSSKIFTVNGDITGWFSHHTGKLSEWYNWGYERKNLNSTEFFNGYKYVLKHFMYDVIAKQSHLNIKPNDISKAVDNKIKMQAKEVVY